MSSKFEEQEKRRREPSAFTKGLCDGTNRTDDYIGSAAIAVKETPALLKKCKEVIVNKSVSQTPKEQTDTVDSAQIVKEIEEEFGR